MKTKVNCKKGKTLKQYSCKECNKKISYQSTLYGKGRCSSCANKKRFSIPENNTMFGKNHTNKSKKKMSLILLKNKSHKGRRNGRYIHGKTLKTYYCEICRKKLCGYRHKLCRSCQAKIRFSNPKNHPFYIDGRSFEKYPKEFNASLRKKILTRDKYTCRKCGITSKKHFKKYKRQLHVHHIDYNRKNCKEDNLLVLCQKCNIVVNDNRKHWENYFNEL
jgi:hypothetical protein